MPEQIEHSPLPWEVVPASEHHGAYIVNMWGGDVADLYAMSNPLNASVRNGGDSYPVSFQDSEANAAFIVKAVNCHDELVAALRNVANTYLAEDYRDGSQERRLGDMARAALSKAGAL